MIETCEMRRGFDDKNYRTMNELRRKRRSIVAMQFGNYRTNSKPSMINVQFSMATTNHKLQTSNFSCGNLQN
jgi:hypothetical protein